MTLYISVGRRQTYQSLEDYFFLIDDVLNKSKSKLSEQRVIVTILKRSCFQSIVDLNNNYLQLHSTKKLVSLFVRIFHAASPCWRRNYCRLSDSNPEPSEPEQLFLINEDPHGFSKVNPKIVSVFPGVNLWPPSVFAQKNLVEIHLRKDWGRLKIHGQKDWNNLGIDPRKTMSIPISSYNYRIWHQARQGTTAKSTTVERNN